MYTFNPSNSKKIHVQEGKDKGSIWHKNKT